MGSGNRFIESQPLTAATRLDRSHSVTKPVLTSPPEPPPFDVLHEVEWKLKGHALML